MAQDREDSRTPPPAGDIFSESSEEVSDATEPPPDADRKTVPAPPMPDAEPVGAGDDQLTPVCLPTLMPVSGTLPDVLSSEESVLRRLEAFHAMGAKFLVYARNVPFHHPLGDFLCPCIDREDMSALLVTGIGTRHDSLWLPLDQITGIWSPRLPWDFVSADLALRSCTNAVAARRIRYFRRWIGRRCEVLWAGSSGYQSLEFLGFDEVAHDAVFRTPVVSKVGSTAEPPSMPPAYHFVPPEHLSSVKF